MHETDDQIDRGSRAEREAALHRWGLLVSDALASGTSSDPLLRTLAWTVRRHPALRSRINAFLDGAAREVAWEQFSSEAEVGQYIKEYSLPALMLSMGLLAPQGEPEAAEFERACLALITAWQRLDFLEDLPGDVREGRVGISHQLLARHGLTVHDLHPELADTEPFGQLVVSEVDAAVVLLKAAWPIATLAAGPHRPFLRAVLRVQELRAAAVRKAGVSLLSSPSGPSKVRSVAALLLELGRRRLIR